MKTENLSQFDTSGNGALGLALQRAQAYADAARAPSTLKVYAGALAQWQSWCEAMRTPAWPAAPEVVAAWLAELARNGKSISRIKVCLAAVLHAHRSRGLGLDAQHPSIATVMAGIARRHARPVKRAPALEAADLARLVAAIAGHDLRAVRDRAIMLVGFWGALRRSEIVALDVTGRSPIELVPGGLLLRLTASKTAAASQTVAIARRQDELCAVAVLEAYLAAARLTGGALFRPISKSGRLLERRLSPASVDHILAQRLGPEAERFSPHSLRAGFMTSAARAGAPEHLIQRISRHKSVSVLRSYIRCADAFAANAGRFIG